MGKIHIDAMIENQLATRDVETNEELFWKEKVWTIYILESVCNDFLDT